MPRPLIVDTGPLYASMDRRDAAHVPSRDLLLEWPGSVVVPVLVVAEVTYLAGRRLGARAEADLLADLADGTYLAEQVVPADWTRIAQLVVRYGDLPLGSVSAERWASWRSEVLSGSS